MALSLTSRGVRLLLGQIQRCVVAANPAARRVTQSATEPEPSTAENESVNPTFRNRNPRNLERMALAMKDRGWKTTWPSREFYHRLVFSRTQKHVTAQVFSWASREPVLSCSTKEWALKKELPSTNCVAACQAVGDVMAQRCKQAGITRMAYRAVPWTYRSDAVQSFRAAMKDGGITLNEPRRKYIGN
ncbi:39S ribosomal protein L18, mitochondrial isoform X1 [Syngnathoides biaculeatus]|uniref:39S ribosomal protein L18, mitochondrial isoform X1 n=1 Tax=Syngnathoides biaculeatus TaxID=300417 RepID=UPI002ADD5EBD|nr:39S ribosomal protein L18, mitochondrial isoform X1 [Syngnathoides biaculeatus]XP_061691484.1 39S ribosomal protein L18, mitochondrial isoform X1 [Syngnathoides biaculeatus]XP_061691485.1 39S ribosomal protein L18, mitochondrial isoform X1 [Syngnathoides biaculeatus]XP_061691488.1 39S ribosomal protein L18, mitochondrial isoform X1 [Syngnathoides biaculeatus]